MRVSFFARHKILAFLCVLLLLLVLACAVSIWITYNYLTVTTYRVASDKISSTVRIAVLSDLHDHEFGDKNSRLIERVREQSPDLIVLDGDIINKYSDDPHVAVDLIRGLIEAMPEVPVYFSSGNHELEYIDIKAGDYESAEYIDIKVGAYELAEDSLETAEAISIGDAAGAAEASADAETEMLRRLQMPQRPQGLKWLRLSMASWKRPAPSYWITGWRN